MIWYATHGTDCSVTRDLHLTWGHFFSHGKPVWPWPVITGPWGWSIRFYILRTGDESRERGKHRRQASTQASDEKPRDREKG